MIVNSFLRAHIEYAKNRWREMLITYVSFFGASQLGIFLYRDLGTSPSLVWPAVGIAFAAVLIESSLIWPAIALAVITNVFVHQTTPLLAIGSVIGNTIQPLIGYFFLKLYGFDRRLSNLRDMVPLVLAGLVFTMIVPSINWFTIEWNNSLYGTTIQAHWVNWWVGGALSALVITPFLIRWIKRPFFHRTVSQYLEIAASTLLLIVVSIFLFGTPYTSVSGISLVYPLLIILFWMAFRCGPRFMTLALLTMTVISLVGAIAGTHAPSDRSLSTLIFSTQVFDLFLAVFFFILVSVEEQRKEAVKKLAFHSDKLENALSRIQSEDAAKNEFLATLAHELRNPLAPLLTSLELLKFGDPDPQEKSRLISVMEERIWVMSRLLEDLLDIARITQRKFTLRKERMIAGDIVFRAVETVQPLIKKQNHTLDVTFPGDVVIHADPARFEQILINLLSNAARYTPSGGSIELVGEVDENSLVIRVSDTGIGIPEEKVLEIFEPFVQLQKGPTQSGGIGIGLALTKHLVDMHKGEIVVQPNPKGQGTQFTVKFPIGFPEDTPVQSDTLEVNKTVFPGKHMVLIVDDNEEAALSLGRLLQLKGYNVSVAHDAKTAFEAIETFRPHAIILDIGLPDISGYEVAQTLRQNGVTSLLVALTGYGQQEDRELAKKAGFDFHLTKPIGFADLEPILRQLSHRL